MTLEEFEQLVAEEFPKAIEDTFKGKIKNVAFLVEDEPSLALRREERLAPNMTLLGHYRGIPHTSRGDYYGVGGTLPDTITLFRIPIEEVALGLLERQKAVQERAPGRSAESDTLEQLSDASIRQVIRETIWHEVAHHFGMNEFEVRKREHERKK